jgi:uncharacterized membrane protein
MSLDGHSCFVYKINAAYVLVLVVMSIKFFIITVILLMVICEDLETVLYSKTYVFEVLFCSICGRIHS